MNLTMLLYILLLNLVVYRWPAAGCVHGIAHIIEILTWLNNLVLTLLCLLTTIKPKYNLTGNIGLCCCCWLPPYVTTSLLLFQFFENCRILPASATTSSTSEMWLLSLGCLVVLWEFWMNCSQIEHVVVGGHFSTRYITCHNLMMVLLMEGWCYLMLLSMPPSLLRLLQILATTNSKTIMHSANVILLATTLLVRVHAPFWKWYAFKFLMILILILDIFLHQRRYRKHAALIVVHTALWCGCASAYL